MQGTNIVLTINGATAAHVLEQARAFGGAGAGDAIASFSTEDLLAELRQRLAPQGSVVRVEPFSSGPDTPTVVGSTTTEAGGRKRGRPSNAEKAAAEKAAADKPAETTSTATKEDPKPTEAGTQQPAAAEAAGDDWDGDEAAKEVTADDVKAALNAFSSVHGSIKAREIMNEVGGSMRLADINPESYAALAARLQAETAKAA